MGAQAGFAASLAGSTSTAAEQAESDRPMAARTAAVPGFPWYFVERFFGIIQA
jgi:hypothetical protein